MELAYEKSLIVTIELGSRVAFGVKFATSGRPVGGTRVNS
jgi:hypothetical protein